MIAIEWSSSLTYSFYSVKYTPEDANVLNAYFTTGSPMESGKKYLFKARFYDKNGKGEINTEVTLTAE